MSKIHILSEHICNKIAAGEVIERPASVVKELVENSLDAGATRISVRMEKAGTKLIAVSDDGEGMDPDDALLCLESHATSKIRSEQDIFSIRSFGFRGEAIPSIASVSNMTLRTRRRELPEGVEILIRSGKLLASQPAGCAPGTEIEVRDLFCNVPARKKFLKTLATEERHVFEVLNNLMLANAHVSFEIKSDGRTVVSSPGNSSLVPRLRELFGKEYADAMVPVARSGDAVSVNGFLSRRSYTRGSRSEQRTFVNGRAVEAPAIYRGVKDGWGPMQEKGRYPVCVLFLSLDPTQIDVNVHPAKREIRFLDEFQVISAVRSAVTAALRVADPVLPNRSESAATPTPAPSQVTLYPDFRPSDRSAGNGLPEKSVSSRDAGLGGEPMDSRLSLSRILESARVEYTLRAAIRTTTRLPDAAYALPFEPIADSAQTSDDDLPAFPPLTPETGSTLFGEKNLCVIGMMENSYIVGTIPGGLVLIDQHAAHERVLFEQILRRTDSSAGAQRLLIPIPIELSRSDLQYVRRNAEAFEQVGFEIEPFGQNTIKLNAIPGGLPQENAGGLFLDILAKLAEYGSAQKTATELIARAACKAAVKAHDRLSLPECEALIRRLAQCELPFSCPHGRPTVLNFSLNEIERRFGRK